MYSVLESKPAVSNMHVFSIRK